MMRYKNYPIHRYTKWQTVISKAMLDFKVQFGIYPEFILCNANTGRNIDAAFNQELIQKGLLDSPQGIGAFYCELGQLIFRIENEIENAKFCLIFDSNAVPKGEGGEIEKEVG